MTNLSATAKRRIALFAFILYPIAFGAYDLIACEDDSQLDSSSLFSTIVGIGAILAWCSFDAAIHDFKISTGLRFGIFLLAIVAVPVYLVKTRGWSPALKIGFGFPAFALNLGAYYLGWYGAYEIGKLTGYY